MTPLISNFIADAASSAMRGFGSGHGPAPLRPNGWPVPVPRKGGEAPVIELVLIKVEVKFGR